MQNYLHSANRGWHFKQKKSYPVVLKNVFDEKLIWHILCGPLLKVHYWRENRAT
jgi:hypothetical protein